MRVPDGSGVAVADLLDRRWLPFALALLLGLSAAGMGIYAGADSAEQARLAARWTARAGLPLFLIAYLASSLLRLKKTDITRALMRRRRQWGLGFALAHSIHLVALAANVLVFAPRALTSLIAGGLVYLLIYAMALTSNDTAMRMLGQWWKRLHTLGIHSIWAVYALSYTGKLTNPDQILAGAVLAPVMFGALGLRLYVRYGRRIEIMAKP
ncbi:MAG: hypothetical protein ABL874_04005 [Sphingopyxis sp.]